MQFTTVLLALSAIGAASALPFTPGPPLDGAAAAPAPAPAATGAKCSSSLYALNAGEDVLSNLDDAITFFCPSPAGFDEDIDAVSGKEGYSILAPVSSTLSVKVFASGPSAQFKNCKAAVTAIKNSCTGNRLKYGRITSGGEYYSVTVIRGNPNEVSA